MRIFSNILRTFKASRHESCKISNRRYSSQICPRCVRSFSTSGSNKNTGAVDGSDKNLSSPIIPVAFLKADSSNKDGPLKILVIPINLFSADEHAIRKTVSTMSTLRKNSKQIDAFTDTVETLWHAQKHIDPLQSARALDPLWENLSSERSMLVNNFWNEMDESISEYDAKKSLDTVNWANNRRHVVSDVPENIQRSLGEAAITSMHLAFEMDMTNIKDALMNQSKTSAMDMESSVPSSLKDPTLKLRSGVECDSIGPEETIPLNFNALIQGTVNIDSSEMTPEKLKNIELPQFNDYVTAIAANICSTALKKGFPTDISRMYSTEAPKSPTKPRSPHIVCVRQGNKGCISPGNANQNPFVPKGSKTNSTEPLSKTKAKKSEVCATAENSLLTSTIIGDLGARGLMRCSAYARALKEAARLREVAKKAKDLNKSPASKYTPCRKPNDTCKEDKLSNTTIKPCDSRAPCGPPKQDSICKGKSIKDPKKRPPRRDPCHPQDPPCGRKADSRVSAAAEPKTVEKVPTTMFAARDKDPPCKKLPYKCPPSKKKSHKEKVKDDNNPCRRMYPDKCPPSTGRGACKRPIVDPCKEVNKCIKKKKPVKPQDLPCNTKNPCKKADASKTPPEASKCDCAKGAEKKLEAKKSYSKLCGTEKKASAPNCSKSERAKCGASKKAEPTKCDGLKKPEPWKCGAEKKSETPKCGAEKKSEAPKCAPKKSEVVKFGSKTSLCAAEKKPAKCDSQKKSEAPKCGAAKKPEPPKCGGAKKPEPSKCGAAKKPEAPKCGAAKKPEPPKCGAEKKPESPKCGAAKKSEVVKFGSKTSLCAAEKKPAKCDSQKKPEPPKCGAEKKPESPKCGAVKKSEVVKCGSKTSQCSAEKTKERGKCGAEKPKPAKCGAEKKLEVKKSNSKLCGTEKKATCPQCSKSLSSCRGIGKENTKAAAYLKTKSASDSALTKKRSSPSLVKFPKVDSTKDCGKPPVVKFSAKGYSNNTNPPKCVVKTQSSIQAESETGGSSVLFRSSNYEKVEKRTAPRKFEPGSSSTVPNYCSTEAISLSTTKESDVNSSNSAVLPPNTTRPRCTGKDQPRFLSTHMVKRFFSSLIMSESFLGSMNFFSRGKDDKSVTCPRAPPKPINRKVVKRESKDCFAQDRLDNPCYQAPPKDRRSTACHKKPRPKQCWEKDDKSKENKALKCLSTLLRVPSRTNALITRGRTFSTSCIAMQHEHEKQDLNIEHEHNVDENLIKQEDRDLDLTNQIIRIGAAGEVFQLTEKIRSFGDYDVLIRMAAIAISGSDIHVYETGSKLCQGITLGHDATGVIQKVGKCVTRLEPGDCVVMESALSCGICDTCKTGSYNMCPQLFHNGFFSTYQTHPADLCHKIPKNLTIEDATLTSTLALACQACFKANITPKTNVLIIGTCPTACAAALCSRALGSKSVAIISSNAYTLESIRILFDLDYIHYYEDEPNLMGKITERVCSVLKERPNVIINYSVSESTMNLTMNLLQSSGICVLAECDQEIASFNALDVIMKNITLVPSFRSASMFPTALHLMRSGKTPIGELISRIYTWDQVTWAFHWAQYESNMGNRKVIVQCPENP